jgi:hypothetical protein
MAKTHLLAASTLLLSSVAFAQPTPAPQPQPPPPFTGCSHCALPDSLGPQDHANNPNSLESMRRSIQDRRMDALTAAVRAKLGRSRAAKAGEITSGKPVHDTLGQLMALVEKIEPDGAVLYNGAATVKVPLEAFGMNKKGLLLGMSKDEFDKMVEGAQATR